MFDTNNNASKTSVSLPLGETSETTLFTAESLLPRFRIASNTTPQELLQLLQALHRINKPGEGIWDNIKLLIRLEGNPAAEEFRSTTNQTQPAPENNYFGLEAWMELWYSVGRFYQEVIPDNTPTEILNLLDEIIKSGLINEKGFVNAQLIDTKAILLIQALQKLCNDHIGLIPGVSELDADELSGKSGSELVQDWTAIPAAGVGVKPRPDEQSKKTPKAPPAFDGGGPDYAEATPADDQEQEPAPPKSEEDKKEEVEEKEPDKQVEQKKPDEEPPADEPADQPADELTEQSPDEPIDQQEVGPLLTELSQPASAQPEEKPSAQTAEQIASQVQFILALSVDEIALLTPQQAEMYLQLLESAVEAGQVVIVPEVVERSRALQSVADRFRSQPHQDGQRSRSRVSPAATGVDDDRAAQKKKPKKPEIAPAADASVTDLTAEELAQAQLQPAPTQLSQPADQQTSQRATRATAQSHITPAFATGRGLASPTYSRPASQEEQEADSALARNGFRPEVVRQARKSAIQKNVNRLEDLLKGYWITLTPEAQRIVYDRASITPPQNVHKEASLELLPVIGFFTSLSQADIQEIRDLATTAGSGVGRPVNQRVLETSMQELRSGAQELEQLQTDEAASLVAKAGFLSSFSPEQRYLILTKALGSAVASADRERLIALIREIKTGSAPSSADMSLVQVGNLESTSQTQSVAPATTDPNLDAILVALEQSQRQHSSQQQSEIAARNQAVVGVVAVAVTETVENLLEQQEREISAQRAQLEAWLESPEGQSYLLESSQAETPLVNDELSFEDLGDATTALSEPDQKQAQEDALTQYYAQQNPRLAAFARTRARFSNKINQARALQEKVKALREAPAKARLLIDAAKTGGNPAALAALAAKELWKNPEFRKKMMVGAGVGGGVATAAALEPLLGVINFLRNAGNSASNAFGGGSTPVAAGGAGAAASGMTPAAAQIASTGGIGAGAGAAAPLIQDAAESGAEAAPEAAAGTGGVGGGTPTLIQLSPEAMKAASASFFSSMYAMGFSSTFTAMLLTMLTVMLVIGGSFLIPTPSLSSPWGWDEGPSQSKYAIISKTSVPKKFQNQQGGDVRYTIEVQAKAGYTIQVTAVSDTFDALGEPPSEVLKNLISVFDQDTLIQYGMISSAVREQYTQTIPSGGIDTLLLNTVEITYDVYDLNDTLISEGEVLRNTSGLSIGNPALACWPASGSIMQGPGGSYSHSNLEAFDIDNSAYTPIYAPFGGELCTGNLGWRYGYHVTLDTRFGGNDLFLIFAHFVVPTPISPTDQTKPNCMEVSAGDQIGLMGTTGFSTGEHLHYEVSRRSRTPIREIITDAQYTNVGDTVTSCFDRNGN